MIPKFPHDLSRPMCIGKGSFASVYRVHQIQLDRWVAVKVIDEHDTARRKSILKEAKTQARLTRKYIPQVYDAFEWKNRVYIVMQWIRGVSLSKLLEHNPSTDERLQLADALIHTMAELHESGYAHRDIKPDNIIISPQDGMYFVDFSFAKNVRDGFESMEDTIKGTPAYMAPELWREGGNRDYFRADVYSIGFILKELLSSNDESELISQCTNITAEKRPASGVSLLKLWQSIHIGAFIPDWEDLTGDLTYKVLADALRSSARELIDARRFDEAYWQLVESIENNPEAPESLELMETVVQKSKTQKCKTVYRQTGTGVAGIITIIGILLSIGYVIKKDRMVLSESNSSGKTISLLQPSGMQVQTAERSLIVQFFADSIAQNALCGKLCIVDIPNDGSFFIQGKKQFSRQEMTDGIALPPRKYLLTWHDKNNAVVWREKVNLLPFQKRFINIRTIKRL